MRRLLRLPTRDHERGSMLTELLVAMVIFGIIATGLAAMAISMIKKTSSTKNDSVAAQLLTKDQDQTRAIGAAGLPEDTGQVLISTTTVGGNTYKVYREVDDYAPGEGTCGVTARTSKRVTTIVKWTEQVGNQSDAITGDSTSTTDGIKTITATTILTPAPDSLLDGTGSYGVVVKDQDGNGLQNIPVTYTIGAAGTAGTTLITNSEGCTLLPNLVAGSQYTAWLGLNPTYVPAGYRHGASAVPEAQTNSIAANTASKSEFVYGRSVKITYDVNTDPLHPVPFNVPFTVQNSAFTTGNQAFSNTYTSTTTTPSQMHYPAIVPNPIGGSALTTDSAVFPYLFPSTLGYASWYGSCPDSDPGASSGKRGANVAVRPGGQLYTGTANVVKVDMPVTNLVANTAWKITAVHDDAVSACASTPSQTYVLAPSNLAPSAPTATAQTFKFALPAGAWKLTVTQGSKTKTVQVKWDAATLVGTTQTVTGMALP